MTRTVSLIALFAMALTAGCKNEPTPTDDTDMPTAVDPDPFQFLAPNDPVGAQLPSPDDYDYYVGAQFEMAHVIGGEDGVTFADDPSIVCTSGCEDDVHVDNGVTLYPVDNGFGYDVRDYSDAVLRERDGVYVEGWVGTINDGEGEPMGVAISSAETETYRVPPNKGSWCAGLNGEPVKCSTEHYVTLEHVLTCYESVPYYYGLDASYDDVCEPLDDAQDIPFEDLVPDENSLDAWSVGLSYGISMKDDGKPLYRFGEVVKKPTDMRLQLTMPLPEEWLEPDAEFVVTRAELAIVHTITNNPNDQIRPEDFENEGATGRQPGYTVDADGRWLSDKDCYSGDGTFLPEGTILKDPAFADPLAISADLREGYTAAWYRTLDRDPFAYDEVYGKTPRYRLQAPKMGQDLPGFEIPITNCQPAPLQAGEKLYERGTLTTTTIDLLDFGDNVSPMASSLGWLMPTTQVMQEGNLTATGMTLTEGFDVAIYIKGDKKPVELYSAHLYLDYEPVTP